MYSGHCCENMRNGFFIKCKLINWQVHCSVCIKGHCDIGCNGNRSDRLVYALNQLKILAWRKIVTNIVEKVLLDFEKQMICSFHFWSKRDWIFACVVDVIALYVCVITIYTVSEVIVYGNISHTDDAGGIRIQYGCRLAENVYPDNKTLLLF